MEELVRVSALTVSMIVYGPSGQVEAAWDTIAFYAHRSGRFRP
jgi:hypothetical protein